MKLIRFAESAEQGTFGRLFLPSGEILFTVERPWIDNKPYVSCVPLGVYSLVDFHSERHGETWALSGETVGVTERDGKRRFACLFHVANYQHNVEGCIGVGLGTMGHDGKWGVSSSGAGMEKLRAVLKAFPAERQLNILWANPFGGD